jgi:ATP-dependent Clp protease ATP-binding subunit ClpA
MAKNINKKFSDRTKALVLDSRRTALKYGNDFISIEHIFLVYNRYRENEDDFEKPLAYLKSAITTVRAWKTDVQPSPHASLFITKQLEKAFIYCDFHRWIMREKKIEPRHIYLSIIAEEPKNKKAYLNFLQKNNVTLGKWRTLVLNVFFNPIITVMRLRRFFK